ncbi:FAD/NAD(P)-binding domain-containing protein [Trametopsis cervina]|nr:FAD/NAD(P)-binding domain-containing protein [Trametopsis cervina]
MKPALVAQLFGAFSPFTSYISESTLADPPVCIIGAGPGGLTAAHELEAKGISTVIFEKQDVVGGKCQAYYSPNGTFHPLGALLFTNQTYHNTLPLVLDANVTLHPGISPHDWTRYLYGPSSSSSSVSPEPKPTQLEMAQIIVEIARYTVHWEQKFAPKYTATRYVNGVPEELAVPMAEWLRSNGFYALDKIMKPGMVPYGYGDIYETPAIYMLQYFTPEILGVFVGITPAYIVDFHEVFVQYAKSVEGPVHLNTEITEIDRSGRSPVIKYKTKGSTASSTQECSQLILAFPPTPSGLRKLNMPLTSAENEVFSKVYTTPYWSSAIETRTDWHETFQQSPFTPLGEPVAFLRLFEGAGVATAWQWGEIDSEETAMKLLTETVSSVQHGRNITGSEGDVTKEHVKALRKWDYFPHFVAEDLMGGEEPGKGVYGAFNKLQGGEGKKTFYTSGLNGFETVEFAIRGAKDLVATFF